MAEAKPENALPPFIAVVDGVADGWVVTASGDEIADLRLGHRYADIAIDLARQTADETPVTFTLNAIYSKAFAGVISPGPIERGFVTRIVSLAMAASRPN